jgi:class 3 adenylate cyclase
MTQPDATTRKLAAILAADVVGYSRLMGEAEEATLNALTACRTVIDGLITTHGGRVFGTAGDSVMAEFPSSVEAVRCAIEIQETLAGRSAQAPEHRRMRFRIGVNLGEVVVAGEQLYGDGVNIAARLESLAEPGGICISDVVRRQIRNKLELGYEDLGEQRLKNISEAVRVYRVRPTGAPAPKMMPRFAPRALLGVGLLLIVAFGGWLFWPRTPAQPTAPPGFFERPAIAVLPFDNLSGDPEQDYFADGLAEDLLTNLSGLLDMPVIARNSSFTSARTTDRHLAACDRNESQLRGVAYGELGGLQALGGRPDDAIANLEKAMRLSPRDSGLWYWLTAMGFAHFGAGRYQEAIAWAERALQLRPDAVWAYRTLAASYAQLGRIDEARRALAEETRLEPDLSVTKVRQQNPNTAPDFLTTLARWPAQGRLEGVDPAWPPKASNAPSRLGGTHWSSTQPEER